MQIGRQGRFLVYGKYRTITRWCECQNDTYKVKPHQIQIFVEDIQAESMIQTIDNFDIRFRNSNDNWISRKTRNSNNPTSN